ncbi:MAG TPA: putative quinol monooxygenase [Gemmatimonadota bacterium]|nr:putative quinol monooxygenase [Gemmatimonadota bacterium]
MSASLTVVVRIKAKPGAEERVEQELRKLLPPTRREEGCINFDLHQSVDDAALFLVHENWVSEEDLGRHFEMPYIRSWIAQADALLAEPMELTRWHRID